jgi:hypothetical protein
MHKPFNFQSIFKLDIIRTSNQLMQCVLQHKKGKKSYL